MSEFDQLRAEVAAIRLLTEELIFTEKTRKSSDSTWPANLREWMKEKSDTRYATDLIRGEVNARLENIIESALLRPFS